MSLPKNHFTKVDGSPVKFYFVFSGVCISIAIITIIAGPMGLETPVWPELIFVGIMIFIIIFPTYKTVQYEEIGKKIKNGGGSKVVGKVTYISRVFAMVFGDSPSFPLRQYMPYVVLVSYNGLTFKSKYLLNDPSGNLKVGSNVDIYIDPNKHSRYYVDTGKLV